jgi:hypothetical protein
MKRGINNIVDIKRGSTNIQKVYRGNNLIWERSAGAISYIYVFRNNSTNTVRKYDLDGNLVATLSTTAAAYINGIFSVKEDDGVIYGGRKSTTNNSTLLKLNPDLTFTTTARAFTFQDIQIGPNCLFTTSRNTLQSRLFDDMSIINESPDIWDDVDDDAVIYSDPYSDNLFLANNGDLGIESFRSFDKTNTTITQNYSRLDTSVNIRISIWTHPDYNNNVWISNSTDSRRYTKDNSLAGVALSNLDIATRDVLILSNGNIVYGFEFNLICRTITNADNNSTTNVFLISQGATVLSLCKDDDDNIYVITATTFRKYTSDGDLVWSIASQSSLTYIVSNKF